MMHSCIIYLHPHFTTAGGAGRMVLETGKRLAERGHQVHCVCIRADPDIVGDYEAIQFHMIAGPLSSSLFFWLGFPFVCKRVLRAVKKIIDQRKLSDCILFPQVFPANWWGIYVRDRIPGIKSVWYCQEPSAFIHSATWINALPWPKNWIAKVLNPILKRVDIKLCTKYQKVLVNSRFSLEQVNQAYGYEDSRSEVVYLGFDQYKFINTEKLPRSNSFVCVAKLTRFKNIDRLIDAIKLVQNDEGGAPQLHIVGSGDALVSLQKQSSRLGLESQIVFHGRVNDEALVRILQSSRGLCLVSVDEPFGLVALEAMACGTPVIAVNSGGPAEIVGNTKAGILIAQPNPELIAGAMRELLKDEAEFDVKSRAARERAAQFHWDETIGKIEQVADLLRNART